MMQLPVQACGKSLPSQWKSGYPRMAHNVCLFHDQLRGNVDFGLKHVNEPGGHIVCEKQVRTQHVRLHRSKGQYPVLNCQLSKGR